MGKAFAIVDDVDHSVIGIADAEGQRDKAFGLALGLAIFLARGFVFFLAGRDALGRIFQDVCDCLADRGGDRISCAAASAGIAVVECHLGVADAGEKQHLLQALDEIIIAELRLRHAGQRTRIRRPSA